MPGTSGDDTINGTRNDDLLEGLGGNDVLKGRKGDDTLNGGDGKDKLDGGAGADRLWGGNGNDTLIGGGGNDRLKGGRGDDVLEGGDGTDWGLFSGSISDYTVTIRADGTTQIIDNVGTDGTDTFSGLEKFRFNDTTVSLEELMANALQEIVLTGNESTFRATEANELIQGSEVRDNIYALGGDDTLLGGGGNDFLDGGDGADTFSGGDGDDRIRTDNDDIRIDGGAGFDTVVLSNTAGAFSRNTLTTEMTNVEAVEGTYSRDDIDLSNYTTGFEIYGARGDDRLLGSQGDDTIIGGELGLYGENTVIFTGTRADYDVSLDENGVATIADQRAVGDGTDQVSNVTYFEFSDVTLTAVELFEAEAGFGTSMSDILNVGDFFADGELNGLGGNDHSISADESGALIVDDSIADRDGSDALEGIEILVFADRTFGNEEPGAPTDGDDTLNGSAAADFIDGLGGNDVIDGGSGNDDIYGNDGDDRLIGGEGDDQLAGGAGADTFVFGPGFGLDVVQDHEVGIDQIEITGLTMDDIVLNDNFDGASLETVGTGDDGLPIGGVIFFGTTVEQIIDDIVFV